MKKAKKMTLDALAAMTQRGFLDLSKEMDNKFGAVDKRFEAVDKRFEAVDKRFEAADQRFDTVEKKLEKVEDAVHAEGLKILQSNDQVVTKLDILLKEHAADKFLHDSHTRRLDRLEKKVGI